MKTTVGNNPKIGFTNSVRLLFTIVSVVIATCTGSIVAEKSVQAQTIPSVPTSIGNGFNPQVNINSGNLSNLPSNLNINGLIETIFSAIQSGNSSTINGFIQLPSNGSNPFLISPGGIVLKSNTSLNVPAAFLPNPGVDVGIRLGRVRSTDFNNTLQTGTPDSFAAIIQHSRAVLELGKSFSANGQLSITALPQENLVRLSEPGRLLSLEIQAPRDRRPLETWNVSVPALPQLLTGGSLGSATSLAFNPDGTVRLVGSDTGNLPTQEAPIANLTGSQPVSDETTTATIETGKRTVAPSNLTDTSVTVQRTNTSCLDATVAGIEVQLSQPYQNYLGISPAPAGLNACNVLNTIQQKTGMKTAILYSTFIPASLNANPANDQMELVLVSNASKPIRKRIRAATRQKIIALADTFRKQVSDPSQTDSESYKESAQQLYQWLIAPIESDLQTRNIQNITFILDTTLSSMPLAALYDGIHQRFLIEKYSVGLMPGLSMTDTRYRDIRRTQVLAMGRSIFTDPNQSPLPAVPVELSLVAEKLWQGRHFLNQQFTLENLITQHQQNHFGIVHLATHGEFRPEPIRFRDTTEPFSSEKSIKSNGSPQVGDGSYIQFWDTKLRLSQLRQLKLDDPPIELLVLSACRTALGDRTNELGFAGLAVQFGVKSALASLWYVSDSGTLGLVAEFYQQLKTAPIKAEALRRAQIAMLHKRVHIHSGELSWTGGKEPLPPSLPQTADLSHPYYWAGFTLVGNPW